MKESGRWLSRTEVLSWICRFGIGRVTYPTLSDDAITLDTNVVSEFMKPKPDPSVVTWFIAQNKEDIYITAVTEAELRRGTRLMPEGRRRDERASIIERILNRYFSNRVLPFDSDVTQDYAVIFAARSKAGREIKHADCEIAAIARKHGAAVATRDTGHFENCGIEVINPWQRD